MKSRGLKLFGRIDFAADAEEAGLVMRPTQLLIFGNPRAGTPLMLAEPTVAIDLPLKALAWEDTKGRVWLSYNSSDYLKERHFLPPYLMEKIKDFPNLLKKAAE